ncbi:MAG: LolA family protein [Flavitalea sp.]
MKRILIAAVVGLFFSFIYTEASAQQADALLNRVKAKLNSVKSYEAEGLIKTDISFIKIPESKVKVLFKNPDKFRIIKEEGISVVPKGGVNFNLSSLFVGNNYSSVLGGKAKIGERLVTIVKLIPLDEKSDIAVSTLYIDEKEAVIRRAQTTTKKNGTYEMILNYGKYMSYGLPDRVIFVFDTKEFKLPKGVTMVYETGKKPEQNQSGQGRVEIYYSSYQVNKQLSDSLFK